MDNVLIVVDDLEAVKERTRLRVTAAAALTLPANASSHDAVNRRLMFLRPMQRLRTDNQPTLGHFDLIEVSVAFIQASINSASTRMAV